MSDKAARLSWGRMGLSGLFFFSLTVKHMREALTLRNALKAALGLILLNNYYTKLFYNLKIGSIF